jgi:hypothetical protein
MAILGVEAFSTPQREDNIIIHGDTLSLTSTPLEEIIGEKADSLRRFLEPLQRINTSCTKGYLATWKLENDHLYLIDLKSCLDWTPIPLNRIFSLRPGEKVLAEWYTGSLNILSGKVVVHNVPFPVQEYGYQVSIWKGRILSVLKARYSVVPLDSVR